MFDEGVMAVRVGLHGGHIIVGQAFVRHSAQAQKQIVRGVSPLGEVPDAK